MDKTTLLEHREFVLHVARALLRNEADAEDAVQDTYVAAMQSAPPREGKARPWLGGIVRNIARNRHRSESRRASREARVARPDHVSGAAESSERLAWQQRVVEAVLALDAKYRDVLVLRYLEDLPPRTVAERLDVPVNTVRTRTRRAIEQLRGSFDKKYGGRKAWSAAIAGLLLTPTVASAGISKLAVAATLLVVTGATGLLLHVTTREQQEPPSRVALSGVPENEAERTRTGESKTGNDAEKTAQAAGPVYYRGQFYDPATKRALAGAEVILGTTSMGWGHNNPMRILATTATDEDGRFKLRWNPSWKLPKGDISSFLLYARKDRRWSDPVYATRVGIVEADGLRVSVELIDNPRFEFVEGASRTPVPGARLSILHLPDPTSIEFGARISEGKTDAQGMVRCEWPSWLPSGLIRLERPNGDVVQWRMELQQLRSYDPYDVLLDPNEVATVYIQVREPNGAPAGAGVRVHALGSWAPDGVLETTYLGRRAPGAEPVPLIGTTNKDGVATFRFPADRARQGFYLPQRMMAFRVLAGKPAFANWEYDGAAAIEDQVARTGRALPVLQFGTHEDRPTLVMRSGENLADIELHGRVRHGRVRQIPINTENFIRVAGFVLYGFREGDAPPHRNDEVVTAVKWVNDGFRCTTLSADEFARCLRGEAVLELGAPQKLRSITIRLPSGTEADEVWLESVERPFLIGDSFNSDGSTTFDLPNIPGKWKVLIDRERYAGGQIDPSKSTDITLDLK